MASRVPSGEKATAFTGPLSGWILRTSEDSRFHRAAYAPLVATAHQRSDSGSTWRDESVEHPSDRPSTTRETFWLFTTAFRRWSRSVRFPDQSETIASSDPLATMQGYPGKPFGYLRHCVR